MWNLLKYSILILTIFQDCAGQTTMTVAPPNVFQNVTVNPSQIVNFTIPGARLLGLLTFLKAAGQRFGGGGFIGRCFGAARKLKLIMPFLLYKLGVIVTTLGFLTLFTLKGLIIGIILLVLNAGGWISKLAFAKGAYFGHGGYGSGWGHRPQGWYGKHSGPPVHIHVHKDRNDGYIFKSPPPRTGPSYASYDSYPGGGGASGSGNGPEYDPSQSWSERISKGFNVNNILSRDLESNGINYAYSRRVSPAQDRNPIR